MCQVRLISVYNDDDDDDDEDDDDDSYKQLNSIIFPFLVVIKQSQVSPYSSTSLTAKSPQVRPVPPPIINHLPATSSLFHPKFTVSSSAHQSFPSSSSVQIKGKAQKVYFVICKLLLSKCTFFSFNSSVQRSTLLFKSGFLGHPKICVSLDFMLLIEPYFHSLEFVILKKKIKKRHESSKTFDEHTPSCCWIQF